MTNRRCRPIPPDPSNRRRRVHHTRRRSLIGAKVEKNVADEAEGLSEQRKAVALARVRLHEQQMEVALQVDGFILHAWRFCKSSAPCLFSRGCEDKMPPLPSVTQLCFGPAVGSRFFFERAPLDRKSTV